MTPPRQKWILIVGAMAALAGIASAASLDLGDAPFDEIRMARSPEFIGRVFTQSCYALEQDADAESDPLVRQEKHAWLAEMGGTFQQSDFLVARNLLKAANETSGDAELRKKSLLKAAAIYQKCLGHDLPYIDIRAYIPAGLAIIDGMIDDPSARQWAGELALDRVKLLKKAGRPEEAAQTLSRVLRTNDDLGFAQETAIRCERLCLLQRHPEAVQLVESALSDRDWSSDIDGWLDLCARHLIILQSKRRLADLQTALEDFEETFANFEAPSIDQKILFNETLYNHRFDQGNALLRTEGLLQGVADPAATRGHYIDLCQHYDRMGAYADLRRCGEAYLELNPDDAHFRLKWSLLKARHGGPGELDGVLRIVRNQDVDVPSQLQAAIKLRNWGMWPKTILDEAFQNAVDLVNSDALSERKLEAIRKIALCGKYFSDEAILDYAVDQASRISISPMSGPYLLDIRFVQAVHVEDHGARQKAIELLSSIQEDFEPSAHRAKVDKFLRTLDDNGSH